MSNRHDSVELNGRTEAAAPHRSCEQTAPWKRSTDPSRPPAAPPSRAPASRAVAFSSEGGTVFPSLRGALRARGWDLVEVASKQDLLALAGEAPGLMLGLSGVGYFYLRMHGPSAVPSVLTIGG